MNAQSRVTAPPVEEPFHSKFMLWRLVRCGFSRLKSRVVLGSFIGIQSGLAQSAEVVTSPVRPECLDGIALTGQSRDSLSLLAHFGSGFAPFANSPARKTSSKTAAQSAERPCPSAPNLSGYPGTGAILF
jgi:hypothetical protein